LMVVAVVGVTPGLWRECGTSDQREAAGPVVSVAGEGAPRYRAPATTACPPCVTFAPESPAVTGAAGACSVACSERFG
jgi:hypothetical protein